MINFPVFMEYSSLFHDQKPARPSGYLQIFMFCSGQSFLSSVPGITVRVQLSQPLFLFTSHHISRVLFSEMSQQTLLDPLPDVILLSELLEVTRCFCSFHFTLLVAIFGIL